MPHNFVLMTALPPHTGHMDLIHFARNLGGMTTVLVHIQDGEPYIHERITSIRMHWSRFPDVTVRAIEGASLPPNPKTDEDWGRWRVAYENLGFKPGDRVVASEVYGVRLAEAVGGVFVPYDLNRTINPVRATDLRNRDDILRYWDLLIPEFRKHLMVTVTLFGAESVGKTTLTQDIRRRTQVASIADEWARPYLETVGPEVTVEKMRTILQAQTAMEKVVWDRAEKPVLVLDTDTHSTVGYWEMWWKDGERPPLGPTFGDSDLYVIPRSNIPFEPDILRYAGNKRESSDQYWIDYCERNELNYITLDSPDRRERVFEVMTATDDLLTDRTRGLHYTRTDK